MPWWGGRERVLISALLSGQTIQGQIYPNIPGKAFLPAENFLSSAEVETHTILGDSLSCPGFQPSGLSKMCNLGLLPPALLEVTLAVLASPVP